MYPILEMPKHSDKILDPDTRKLFFSKIGKPDNRGCLNWLGNKDRDGYGLFTFYTDRQRLARSHRLAYQLQVGPIPKGLFVCHKCDNPACQNVKHFFLGTAKDNGEDKARKGRSAKGDANGARLYPERLAWGDDNPSRKYPERLKRGSEHYRAKLTEKIVRKIRAAYSSRTLSPRKGGVRQQDLADHYGVSQLLVSLIVRRKIWKHV